MSNPIASDIRFSIVPEWILDAEISDRAVRVYAILARYADSETLQAFPSRETIAKRAFCHYKSVDRAIDELVKIKAIVKSHRRSGESYQSNLYTLRRVPPQLSLPTDTGDGGVRTPVSPPTDTAVHLTRTTELEPTELENARGDFDRFWELYPRKVGKIAARKAWEKITNPDDVIEGVNRLLADPNRPSLEFLPHPSTWLNEGRWEDEPYPARQAPESRFVKPAAEGPGRGDWKRWYHDQGDHCFCDGTCAQRG